MPAITKRKGAKGTSYKVQVRKKGFEPQTKTFRTLESAKTWAKRVEAEMDSRGFVRSREAETTSLYEALTRYAETIVAKKADPVKERSFIRLWQKQSIADLPLTAQSASDIAKLRDKWLEQGLKPSTVVRRLRVLSHLFTVARKEWGFKGLHNPLFDVSFPTVKDSRSRTLKELSASDINLNEDEDEDDIFDRDIMVGELGWIIKYTRSKYLPKCAEFAIETAMRRSELLGLRWENVNFNKYVAFLPETKNGASREVPLSSRAIAILKKINNDDNIFVFNITPDALTKAFIRALNRARGKYEKKCMAYGEMADPHFLVGLRFHDLRHEATTRLAKIFQIHELAKITGHKTTQMLLRYYHPKAEELALRLRNDFF